MLISFFISWEIRIHFWKKWNLMLIYMILILLLEVRE
jgi:cell division protein FtsW (lipid II flippase)